jgi:vacuolar-type H+-ATPase subunit E/Vma4
MTATTETAAALAPVRARIRSDASAVAERILASARAQSDAMLAQARSSAEHTVEQAAAEGHAAATALAAAELARGRERAWLAVLTARREAYDELRRRVRAAAGGLPGTPGYDQFATRLADIAAGAAAPGSTVTVPPGGGAMARSGQMVVDCSLPRLADLAVEALGDKVRELWTP